MNPTPTIAQQLAALRRLTVKELQLRYADLFGDATAARNKAWLVKRIACKGQAAPAEPDVKALPFPADRRLPPAGSVPTRAYKGQTLRVRVLRHGSEYAGLVYPSLSAVAKAVTGSHCNGYLFFRVTRGGDA